VSHDNVINIIDNSVMIVDLKHFFSCISEKVEQLPNFNGEINNTNLKLVLHILLVVETSE